MKLHITHHTTKLLKCSKIPACGPLPAANIYNIFLKNKKPPLRIIDFTSRKTSEIYIIR